MTDGQNILSTQLDDEMMNELIEQSALGPIAVGFTRFLEKEDLITAETLQDDDLLIADISKSSSQPKDTQQISFCKSTELKEAEIRSLLSQWNLEHLADVCIANNVFVDILKIIKRHHIERLLSAFDLGTQIVFEHKLEEWRESIGILLDSVQQNSNSRSSSSSSISPTDGLGNRTSIRYMPYDRSPTPDNCTIMLSHILNDSSRGKGLVNYYNKFSQFHEDQRSILISLIAQHYEEKGVKMSLSTSYQLEKQILERFPSEKLEYYRTAKRGRIYNKFYNLSTSFKVVTKPLEHESEEKRSSGNPEKFSRYIQNLEPETEADSYLKALKFDNLSAEEFDFTWKACCQYRLQFIKNNNFHEILEKWPFYKTPSGYRLIDMDFKAAFSKSDSTLLDRWEESYKGIASFLSIDNHVKDKNAKKMIDTLTNGIRLSENGRDAALMWALHAYFVPTSKIIRVDPGTGKKSTVKFTIKDSQESVLYIGETQQVVEDYIEHIKKTKVSVQPSIFCVGKDIFSITDIFLYIEGVRYKFKSFLKALDICFKCIYLFDFKFPEESIMFYSFIECFFYGFNVTKSFAKVHIMLQYLENNIIH